MPFFVPALVSLCSDLAILVLVFSNASVDGASEEASGDSLVPLAIVRLVLLVFPLPYHNYSGTAVKCPLFYEMLYGSTLIVVLIQLLGIMIMDPESLSTIVPGVSTQRMDHSTSSSSTLSSRSTTMAHTWWILWLNLMSNLLHIVLLWHVRSTAPAQWTDRKHVLYFYTQQQQQQQSVMPSQTNGRIRMTARSSNSNGHHHDHLTLDDQQQQQQHQRRNGSVHQGTNANNTRARDLLERMRCVPEGYDEIMSGLQQRFQETKNQWTQRLEDFTIRMNRSTHGATSATALTLLPLTPFRVLLQLFAYEKDVIPQLDLVFEKDDGIALTFYVPQLISFLLHGAYHNAPDLEAWILGKCQQNVFFAHQCFWFIRAWCLEGSHAEQKEQQLMQQLLSLQQQQAKQQPNASSVSRSSSFSSLLGSDVNNPHLPKHKYPPEDRSAMEALLQRVVECGTNSCRKLHESAEGVYLTSGPLMLRDERGLDSLDTSPSAVMTAIEAGFLPIDPDSVSPSVGHLDSIYAREKIGLLPKDLPPPEHCFLQAPNFLDALLNITDSLMEFPREQRTKELRRQLQSLELEFLPSNVIYVPVTKTHHRIWRIVADESIAISTKERVPCIVALEVIDYSPVNTFNNNGGSRNRGFSASGILDLIQRQHSQDGAESQPQQNSSASIGSTNQNGNYTTNAPPSPGGKSSIFGGVNHHFHSPIDERELVYQWRMARRHPRRFETFFDKVTTFTRDTVHKLQNLQQQQQQQPLQHHFEDAFTWVGGRSSSGIVREGFDEETANLIAEDANNSQLTPVKSNSSVPLDPAAAMGQWSSPVASNSPSKTIPQSRGSLLRTASGRLSYLRSERAAANEMKGLSSKDELAIDALLDIRHNMEVRHDFSAGDGGTGSMESMTMGGGGTYSTMTVTTSAVALTSVSTSTTQKQPRAPPVVFKESWAAKEARLRSRSVYGEHPNWRLLPILLKSNDDLRQEQMASQLIYRMASILAHEKVPVWLCPYEIIALTDRGGIIEAIPDTISLDSLKRNDPNFVSLANFFETHFEPGDDLLDAKANFVESLAAYSVVSYLLQIKDRHNGNILLDNRGHLIHIDFGFFFLSSPGKNSGFESAPFKLTTDFCHVMGGPHSTMFRMYRELCCRTFLSLRKHCIEITLLVEMLTIGNEDLNCFRGRPDDAVRGLRERFRLELNDRACADYVNGLVDDSLENWRTRWYDRYQRFCVGVL